MCPPPLTGCDAYGKYTRVAVFVIKGRPTGAKEARVHWFGFDGKAPKPVETRCYAIHVHKGRSAGIL